MLLVVKGLYFLQLKLGCTLLTPFNNIDFIIIRVIKIEIVKDIMK